jgi:hypothetical protein
MNKENVMCIHITSLPPTHTLEYYSTLKKKKEVHPFAIVWMKLEDIMLSETSQTLKDRYRYIHMESKNRVKWWVPRASRREKWGNVSQGYKGLVI